MGSVQQEDRPNKYDCLCHTLLLFLHNRKNPGFLFVVHLQSLRPNVGVVYIPEVPPPPLLPGQSSTEHDGGCSHTKHSFPAQVFAAGQDHFFEPSRQPEPPERMLPAQKSTPKLHERAKYDDTTVSLSIISSYSTSLLPGFLYHSTKFSISTATGTIFLPHVPILIVQLQERVVMICSSMKQSASGFRNFLRKEI